ncbi:MAG: histidine kinase [Aeromicrobium sp.]|nr:histidine kinase [Burkholderiales bacterium]
MTLPPKVQAAVDVLTRFDVHKDQVAPLSYRVYLRLKPTTPPPLWGASPAYWTFVALTFAFGSAALFFSGATYWLFQQGRDPVAELLSPAPQFVLWSFFGFIGWATASGTADQMKREAAGLQLPAWDNFTSAWRPAIDQVAAHANPNRYWLAALKGEPVVKRAEFIGVIAFVALASVLPAKAASIADALALVYFVLCIVANQRGPRGRTLATAGRARNAWFIQHGVWIGFLATALVWNFGFAVHVWPNKTSDMLAVYCLLAFLMHYFDRARFEQQRLLLSRVEKSEQDKQLAEIRLQSLKAQIEPHFIFNTIAHLKSMIATDPALAERMADELSDFLRASLDALNNDWSTVRVEMELARAYLEIAKLRMGSRLSTDLQMDDGAADIKIPPLMLQTLLENAIQHGLEPKVGKGSIHATATFDNSDGARRLRLCVVDDGVGFGMANSGGSGIGLANIRERLASAYGGRARFTLTANTPSGVIAELNLPVA